MSQVAKQELVLDDVGHQKNSSALHLSLEVKSILEKLVSEELAESGNAQTKKDYFLQIATQFEVEGIPKEQISKTTLLAIEQSLSEKLSQDGIPKERCKLSASSVRHLKRTMKEAGYTDPFYARNTLEEKTKKETKLPDGLEFVWLNSLKELFSESVSAINTCISKCTLDESTIHSQIEKNRVKNTQADYDELYKKTQSLVNKRIKNVKDELYHIRQKDIDGIKSKTKQIIAIQKKLNDKTKLTKYEKELARILIQRFAYDNGTIASILNINTKHIKNNILRQKQNPHDQDSVFKQLEFLARCPGCGLGIADYIDEQHEKFKKGKTISENFVLDENFPLPEYAVEVVQLKQKIREQEIAISELEKE